ncbi:MAG TPA: SufD family Fe-S cluster assembly protein [Acidimicrobiales bacterium]|nr:SufD family Fe-S cluster assembly protein [Acidimicrobiales bacterium]
MARRRAEAFERFSGTEFPSESEEVWRYSGIDDFDPGSFAPKAPPPAGREGSSELDLAEDLARVIGERSALVVTRDGVLRAVEQEEGPAAAHVGIGSVLTAPKGERAPSGLGELAHCRDAFDQLHEAFLADVVVVSVAPKAEMALPVVVVHLIGTPEEDPEAAATTAAPACFPRTVVRVGRSATAGVVELFASVPVDGTSGDTGRALVVPVTELEVADDARLEYASLQVLGPRCTQVALQASRVGAQGSLRSFTASLGGSYSRVRTDSDVAGDSAQSSLLAAYLGVDDQVHDFRTLQDHHGPRTRSELLFKGAVADRARSVYSGLIRIARGAHGADAFQTNHNLVLSEGAHADSVPNLDIDENDVRCSHASTVGPIDEEQRYYLESRGVEPWVAERLIVLGFFSDLAARAPFGGVGKFLEDFVGRRLEGRLPAEELAAVQGSGTDG